MRNLPQKKPLVTAKKVDHSFKRFGGTVNNGLVVAVVCLFVRLFHMKNLDAV